MLTVPEWKGHTMPCRNAQEHQGWAGDEGARVKTCFPQEERGEAAWAGLGCLVWKNFSGFWSVGAISSHPAIWLWGDWLDSGPECKNLVEVVGVWASLSSVVCIGKLGTQESHFTGTGSPWNPKSARPQMSRH